MKSLILSVLLYGSVLASGLLTTLDTRLVNGAKTVNTTSGLVSGHAASNASTNVAEYLGIPFAKPPVGDLRFAPPVRYEGVAAINGTSFGYSCPTTAAYKSGGSSSSPNIAFANLTAAGINILGVLAQITDRFSEDCLTLNVWVPSGGEARKAVMVWIYGGGFSTGATSTSTYNGQNIAAQEDVIVVSINYRVNIFGFPGNPSLPNLNLGLLDQRLAIEWVRDNIASFGGDASRITLFGQSAGSASIDYYSYAYVSDPIIAGMIQESGTVNGFGQVSTNTANAAWFNVTSTVGCGSASSNATDVLTCMRTKTPAQILNAIPATPAGSVTGGLSNFGPAIDNITVFPDYATRSAAGNFIKVPLLTGNNDYEAGLFAATAALANATYALAFWAAFDLSIFACPAATRANISLAAGVPTWRYRYFGDFPDLRLTSVPDSGAWHGGELPLLFGNYPNVTGIPPITDAEGAIADYMRGAWAAFAKDPSAGLSAYEGGWPRYAPAGNTLVRLAWNNMTGTNLAVPGVYDAACGTRFAYNGTGNSTASGTGLGTATGTATGTTSSSSATASPSSQSGGSRVVASGCSVVALLALGVLFRDCF